MTREPEPGRRRIRTAAAGEKPAPETASILAMHGGGFMGYFAAKTLAALDAHRQSLGLADPLARSFDAIAGTSVGAILAAGIACEVPTATIVALMEEHGAEIFPNVRWFRKYAPGIRDARFPAEPLRKRLDKIFGGRTLGEVGRVLVVPAINESTGRAVVFRSHDPKQGDFPLVDAVLASAAAPTYLPLHLFRNERYTDGGLMANGPELVAAIDLQSRFGVAIATQRVVSIGTTHPDRASPAPAKARLDWGAWHWMQKYNRLMPLLMSAQVELQSDMLAALGPAAYLHLDLELGAEDAQRVHMVRTDETAKRTLRAAAERLFDDLTVADLDALEDILLRRARRLEMRKAPGSPDPAPHLVDPG